MNVDAADWRGLKVSIRWMIGRDKLQVLQIEETSFEFPWTDEDFANCLRVRNCVGMVAELDDRVVGFYIYELHKTRLHILNFAVHPGYRREQIGMQMVQKLIDKLSSHRRTSLTLEIRESNLSGQLFWKAAGFRAVRIVRGFYEDTHEDAIVFQRRYRPPDDQELESEPEKGPL